MYTHLHAHRHLASHEHAVQVTRGMEGLMNFPGLQDELIWGTSALKHATSWMHMDDEGFATVVTNMVGCKYWVLARPRRDAPKSSSSSSIFHFGETLAPSEARRDIFEHEAVLLRPGSVL